MCDECDKLQANIERYQKIVAQGLDPLTIERINALILQLQQRKDTLHH
jgi:hypothetical protein